MIFFPNERKKTEQKKKTLANFLRCLNDFVSGIHKVFRMLKNSITSSERAFFEWPHLILWEKQLQLNEKKREIVANECADTRQK